jgi:hypothetical protein
MSKNSKFKPKLKTQEELLKAEKQEWQKIFLEFWELDKKDHPNISFEKSLEQGVKIRVLIESIVRPIFEVKDKF